MGTECITSPSPKAAGPLSKPLKRADKLPWPHTAEWTTDQTFKVGHKLRSIRWNTFNMKRENNTTFNM